MAEFVIKVADDRGRVQQHVEQGYSEAEVRDRFTAFLHGTLGRRASAVPADDQEALEA